METGTYQIKIGGIVMKTMKKVIAMIMILSLTVALGQGLEPKKVQAESYQNATMIQLNGGWTGDKYFTEGDEEQWYKLYVPSDGKVEMKVMAYMYGIRVRLYNDDLSNEIKYWGISEGSTTSPSTDTLGMPLTAGTYYIKMTKDGWDTGKYKLNTTFKSYGTTDTNAYSYDSPQNLTVGKDMIGAITMTDEEDWYKVKISKTGYYHLKITEYMESIHLTVYNADLSKEVESISCSNGGENSPSVRDEDIVLSAGTYYIKVRGYYDWGKYILNLSALSQANCNHDFENTTVSATYLRKGYTLHKCKKCGKTTKDEYTAKLTLGQGYIWSYGMQPGKKKIRVSYSYIRDVSGYQIRYSTNKKFKKGVKTVKAGKNTQSKTLKKLKKKKRYYVQVRGYKKVSGKVVYGKWSAKRSAKTK